VPRALGSPHAHGRSELKERPAVMRALREEQRRLGARLRALREGRALTQEQAAEQIGLHSNHLQRLERGAANVTLATLVAVALAYRVSIRSLFEEPPLESRFSRSAAWLPGSCARSANAVPLYSLKAAAGRFGAQQQVEPEGWVRPLGRTRPGNGLFVAQVVGDSMRPPHSERGLLPVPTSGAGQPQWPVVLAQHRQIHDPDHGGRYTVKVYQGRKQHAGAEGGRTVGSEAGARHGRIGLPADRAPRAGRGRVDHLAELVEVLPGA